MDITERNDLLIASGSNKIINLYQRNINFSSLGVGDVICFFSLWSLPETYTSKDIKAPGQEMQQSLIIFAKWCSEEI